MGLAERVKRGFKPRDVEEFIDYYFHRPLAGLMVQLLLPLPITPNQVTILSGIAGLAAGVAVGAAGYRGDHWAAVGGALLLLSILLDCADGQLARLRGVASPAGRVLDGLIDFVAPTAVFLGQAVFLTAKGMPLWFVLAIGIAGGGSLLWHAGQFDSAKNIYLYNANPEFDLGGDALLTREYVERLRIEYREKGEIFNSLLMWGFNKWWLSAQEKGGTTDLGQDAPRAETEPEREAFRAIYRGNMYAWTWLGFGTHMFLLTASSVGATWEPRIILGAWLIMAVPMNVLCGVLLARRKSLLERFKGDLAGLRAS